ncbi:MAG TPA: maleylpyruvate isomerase family mycothiol-dependent enzyme [Streptosporangiaceae bacterium]|nr:maleylpyruvate isomerase family mycothiol-dependent enzyme [Streptosporangiaceae bacterium]
MRSGPRAWIAALRGSHERLAGLVRPLTPEQIRARSFCTDWSIAQVLSHVGSGAEISLLMLPGALGDGESPGPENFQAVWDVWNAKTPDEQAADALISDERQVQALEQLTDEQLRKISLPFFGMDLDAVGLVRLRLGEHAVHTWDVAVALDPAATVSPDAVDLLIDNVPQFLAPRLGKTPADPFAVRIRTTGPDRDYLLATADTVIMTEYPEDGTDVPVGEVAMPAEALLRLAYGRLDPAHTPPAVTGAPADLNQLRNIFPGF